MVTAVRVQEADRKSAQNTFAGPALDQFASIEVSSSCAPQGGRRNTSSRGSFSTRTRLKDRVLFGSDSPAIPCDRRIADFGKIAIKPDERPLIMKENAVRLLQLGLQAA